MLNNKELYCNNLISFIRDIYKTKGVIPLHEPLFNGNEKKYVLSAINSSFVSSVGKYVNELESRIAKFTGSKYAIATCNGTSALHISLIINGCDTNTEILTQSLSFVATSNAIMYCGAKPIFIDVERDTLGMSPECLQSFLEENCEIRNDGKCWNKRTNRIISACLPMHTYGFMLRINEIKKICKSYRIPLIEDSAESMGSYLDKQHSGTFGAVSAFSFNGNKIMTTGGGGMIITDNKIYAKTAKHLTTTAKISHEWNFIHDSVGYNYRMPNLNAALGLAQLEQMKNFIKKKKKISTMYKKFADQNNLKMISGIKNTKPNNWLNILLAKDLKQRDLILRETHNHNILTRPAWEPLHLLKMYKNCQKQRLKNTMWLYKRIVCLPSSVKDV
tara:strand:+ start:2552 stop:3718 length:1167 start_codon:yes stop_codon:yes gene_type:complete